MTSSELEESDDDKSARKSKKLDKHRALIQSGDGSEEGQDMEVTFSTGLEDKQAHFRKRVPKLFGRPGLSQKKKDPNIRQRMRVVILMKKKWTTFLLKSLQERKRTKQESMAELELLAADDNGEDTNLKPKNPPDERENTNSRL